MTEAERVPTSSPTGDNKWSFLTVSQPEREESKSLALTVDITGASSHPLSHGGNEIEGA